MQIQLGYRQIIDTATERHLMMHLREDGAAWTLIIAPLHFLAGRLHA
jgi:hypothetical protein